MAPFKTPRTIRLTGMAAAAGRASHLPNRILTKAFSRRPCTSPVAATDVFIVASSGSLFPGGLCFLLFLLIKCFTLPKMDGVGGFFLVLGNEGEVTSIFKSVTPPCFDGGVIV